MKKNIGKIDRAGRLVLGILLLLFAFFSSLASLFKIIIILAALFIFYEALVGWCAFYALIGKNTCPIKYE